MFQNQEKEEEQLPWHSVAVKHNATKTTNDNKIGMSMITHMTFFHANLNHRSAICLTKKCCRLQASICSGAKNVFAQKINTWMTSLQALNVCDLAWLDFLFCFITMMTKPVGESSDDEQ